MGEIGNNFLPEDIFADVESDISNNVVRKNDQHMEEMVQDNNKANINQKKGKNFDKKHLSVAVHLLKDNDCKSHLNLTLQYSSWHFQKFFE